MTKITLLLLVLTFTGHTVASVVCGAECRRASVTVSHCHGDEPAGAEAKVSGIERCTEPSVSVGPYVVQHRATDGAAVLAITAADMTPTMVRTDAPPVIIASADGLRKPPLVLRL